MSSPVAQTIGTYGYVFTFPLGVIGHFCSLLTFSCKTLRTTSTGLLFIFLTISDSIYQLMTIMDFLTQNLQIRIIESVYLCRFRTFILNFSTITSSWFLVLIASDRFIRVCFPYQQARICTQKMVYLSVTIVCICSIIFNSHVFQSEFGYTFAIRQICGPSRTPETNYSIFYFQYWPFIQLLITYLIPFCLMIICLIGIKNKIHHQQVQIQTSLRREKIQRNMLILMISTAICFSLLTIPYSIHRIIYLKVGIFQNTYIEIAIFTIFLNFNYSFNFYLHCLSSKFFRQVFMQRIRSIISILTRQTYPTNHVIPMSTVTRTQK